MAWQLADQAYSLHGDIAVETLLRTSEVMQHTGRTRSDVCSLKVTVRFWARLGRRVTVRVWSHLTETRGSSSFASTSCRLPMDSILTLRGFWRAAAAAPALGSIGTNDCSAGVGCGGTMMLIQHVC